MAVLTRSLFPLLPSALLLCAAAALPGTAVPAQSSAGAPAPDGELRATVDRLVRPFLASDAAPGAIVAISWHGERSFFTYGSATDDGHPFTPTTMVEIGSCTKVFTTTLFALAIGRHQMDPDAPAQQYMPSGYRLQPTAQAMTPRELAQFTSGMPDDPSNLPPQLEMRGIESYTTKDFLKWVSGWTPRGPLPAPYLYSNAGAGLLAYLVAEATHTPWDAEVQGEIAAPLGMVDTLMRPNAEQSTRLAQGHHPNGSPAPPWPVFAWFGGGALRSTAADMLRFGEANLGHPFVDGKPVPPALTAAMQLAQTPSYPLPNGDAMQGMAWVTNTGDQPGLAPEVLKNGGTVGFGTVILTNRKKDLVIFIAVNQNKTNPAPLAVKMGRQIR